MISYLALQLSETLGFMSLMALLVCIYRLSGLPTEVRRVIRSPITDLSQRRMFLIGFGLYMAGAVMRESTVLAAGMVGWNNSALMTSTISRVIQVVGACVYVRGASLPLCGEAGWLIILGMSVTFSIVSPL